MTEIEPQHLDAAGAETLAIMQEAPAYNAWQYARIAPYLGKRVCEIGSGIGNMSAHLLTEPRELAVLTDMSPYYLGQLRDRFGTRPDVAIEPLRLPDSDAAARFASYHLDSVVALNVIEHIQDDVGAIRCAAGLLRPGGRVVVLVPALQLLYGSLDEALGHVRRYSRRSIAEIMRRAGLNVERTFYLNLVGTVGWWFNARVRRSTLIPRAQLRLFDSLVPLFRIEDRLPLPFGQSVIAIGRVEGQ